MNFEGNVYKPAFSTGAHVLFKAQRLARTVEQGLSERKKCAFSTDGLFIFSWSQYTSESFWEVFELLRRCCVTTESASLI